MLIQNSLLCLCILQFTEKKKEKKKKLEQAVENVVLQRYKRARSRINPYTDKREKIIVSKVI